MAFPGARIARKYHLSVRLRPGGWAGSEVLHESTLIAGFTISTGVDGGRRTGIGAVRERRASEGVGTPSFGPEEDAYEAKAKAGLSCVGVAPRTANSAGWTECLESEGKRSDLQGWGGWDGVFAFAWPEGGWKGTPAMRATAWVRFLTWSFL